MEFNFKVFGGCLFQFIKVNISLEFDKREGVK